MHHILTLVALGATPEQVKDLYDINLGYQRDAVPPKQEMVENLSNPSVYKKAQGDENMYMSFLQFYQKEIAIKGVPAVVQEYVFAEDHRADDMLVRLFMGTYFISEFGSKSPLLIVEKRGSASDYSFGHCA